MRVLITGGCGFIGSNFIRYFNCKHPYYKILNVDKLTYAGNLENLKGMEKKGNYHFVRADISSAAAMRRIFEKFRPDAVINFAAETHVDRSIMSPAPFIKTNVVGVGVLLNLSLKYQIKKFLQISTDEVYGSILHGSFREDSPLDPSSPYAASKAAADMLVLSYYKTHGLPILITRSSNNYGPYQFPEKLIPLVILNALNNRKIPVYGDGMNVRDWLYVEDNCEAIDLVFHEGKIGEIYNIGGENELTNLYVVKYILRLLGKSESLITFVKDRPGHDRRYSLSLSKIRRQLGWHPKVSFETGLKRTIEWYRKNQKWLKNAQSGEYRNFYKQYYSKLGLKEF
ncbi:MAG: dTDP-glucose 4,6-dehydratase [candidate division WOR-3 bacterium]